MNDNQFDSPTLAPRPLPGLGCGRPVVWPSHIVQHQALSPAKLNLFLHVTGRRADGYHLLQSLFCPLQWGDTVVLTLAAQGLQQVCAGPQQVAPGWVFSRDGGLMHIPVEQDLAWRAALALVNKLPLPPQPMHLHLHVHKRIPEQAGLGGGSSNAATVLLLLNHALGQPFNLPYLAELALPLGADVPFFLHNSAAWVEGIGEHITPLVLPKGWVLIYKPPLACPTATIFANPGLERHSLPLIWPFAKNTAYLAPPNLPDLCIWLQIHTCNALQAVVGQTEPTWQVQFAAFAALCARYQALLVRMSGSGSAMFAVFAEQDFCQKALLAAEDLSLPGQWVACAWGAA